MIKNDRLLKLMFALELAFLPMVFFAKLYLPNFAVGLFILGIAVARIWAQVFMDKTKTSHVLINSIGDIAVFTTLFVFFAIYSELNKVVLILDIIMVVLMDMCFIFLRKKHLPETILAADLCFFLFEGLALIALTFALDFTFVASVGLFAILLTALFSLGYKSYFIFRYCGVLDFFKRIFQRR